MSNELTFSRVHFLEENEPSHVIVCQDCTYAFDPEILTRHMQSLLRLACSARSRLDQGISPGFLKLQLMSDGLQESLADNLIAVAQH
jgi:hypothetical protein